VGNRQLIRVVFKRESETTAFAAEFSGLLLASSVPDAAIA